MWRHRAVPAGGGPVLEHVEVMGVARTYWSVSLIGICEHSDEVIVEKSLR